jgi:preprotein translocase subunit YajC
MFITPAFAQGASAFGGTDMLSFIAPFGSVFIIFYFLMIRPQQKRAKDHQTLVSQLRRGDTVVTSGGLVGKITKVVDDNEVEVQIADNVRVRQLRQLITEVRAKGEPAKDDGAA